MSVPSRKYGLFTAIAMVVGIVIGSGVFKSAGDVLAKAGGNMSIAILAWLIGGLIIIVSTYSFSIVALKNAKGSGIISFIEELAGDKTAYIVGWFVNIIYFPALVSILSWLSGSISNSLLGFEVDLTWYLAIFFFVSTYSLNIFAPVLAGKWQVSTMSVKLIPLILIAFGGLIVGLINGTTVEAFTETTIVNSSSKTGLAAAVALTAFAYDGWITSLSITQELKDAKKNLSKALIGGALIIVTLYILFFIGISGVVSNSEAIALAGSLDTSILAVERLFGNFFGPVLAVLILVSVLGTLNGLSLASVRGMYQISLKNVGPFPELFQKLGKKDQPYASGLLSFVLVLFFGFIWFGNFKGYWGGFMDISVLPIVFLYGSFIIVYIDIIKNFKELNTFKRFIIPSLSIIGALYMIYGALISDPKMFLYFTLLVIVFTFVGYIFYKKDSLTSIN